MCRGDIPFLMPQKHKRIQRRAPIFITIPPQGSIKGTVSPEENRTERRERTDKDTHRILPDFFADRDAVQNQSLAFLIDSLQQILSIESINERYYTKKKQLRARSDIPEQQKHTGQS
jgi:hypothetical protein